jgi:hypothetical protein
MTQSDKSNIKETLDRVTPGMKISTAELIEKIKEREGLIDQKKNPERPSNITSMFSSNKEDGILKELFKLFCCGGGRG